MCLDVLHVKRTHRNTVFQICLKQQGVLKCCKRRNLNNRQIQYRRFCYCYPFWKLSFELKSLVNELVCYVLGNKEHKNNFAYLYNKKITFIGHVTYSNFLGYNFIFKHILRILWDLFWKTEIWRTDKINRFLFSIRWLHTIVPQCFRFKTLFKFVGFYSLTIAL